MITVHLLTENRYLCCQNVRNGKCISLSLHYNYNYYIYMYILKGFPSNVKSDLNTRGEHLGNNDF